MISHRRNSRINQRPSGGPQSGVALVIVLSIVVLLAALVIGFLARTGSERASAANYTAAISSRQLGETAVNLVQGAINQATTRGSTSGSVWASQPGAIRVFGSSGSLNAIYRLYSASAITASAASDLDADVAPAGWASAPAEWIDLNAPVARNATSGTTLCYPILDARNATGGALTLDGFTLASPPGATTTQPAPMPVRWLYALKDGQLIAPSSAGSGKLNIAGASAANPVVGRVAFWTDDETCKVNVNTAADGTFWDTPHINAPDEKSRAKYQPAHGEYQRYPGHPATTSIKPILTALGMSFNPYPAAAGTTSSLFKLLPRYNDDNGSKQGTAIPTSTPSNRTERLYSSVGELLFDQTRTPTQATRQETETAGFFLTAHSRAPELNLFGQPRVAVWPVSATNDSAHRTPIDQLIAFCSTINGKPYYFSRADSRSPVTDISATRNSSLLNYLDGLTASNEPGVNTSFDTKYGQVEKRQILTDLFDYVRCTNLQDSTSSLPYAPPDPAANVAGGQKFGMGQVVPSIHPTWGSEGFGRFYRITEVSLIFVGVGQGKQGTTAATKVLKPQADTAGYIGTDGQYTPADGTVAVQAFLVFNFFDPSLGWSCIYPNFRVEVTGLDALTLNGTPMSMPPSASTMIQYNVAPGTHARVYGVRWTGEPA